MDLMDTMDTMDYGQRQWSIVHSPWCPLGPLTIVHYPCKFDYPYLVENSLLCKTGAMLSLLLTIYISSPAVEMRAEPNPRSEVVSQAIFSEEVALLEEQGDWVKIQTKIDSYPGWIKKAHLCTSERPHSVIAKVNRCAAHLYGQENVYFGPLITLPFESRLEVIEPKEPSNSRWIKVALPDGRKGYIQRGDVLVNPPLLNLQQMCSLSLRFVDLPYTWGGRSSFGYDCSGFTQMLYRQMGILIPRDAKDQMNWKGFREVAFGDMRPGDLIFFGLSENQIKHVGMYLGEGKMIHACAVQNAPYLRISSLSEFEWSANCPDRPYRTVRSLK